MSGGFLPDAPILKRELKEANVDAGCLHSFVGEHPESSVVIDHLYPSFGVVNDKLLASGGQSCPNHRMKQLRHHDSLFGNISVPLQRGTCRSIDEIVQGYQVLFERTSAFSYTNFLGVPLQQDPNDAFAIMDLIWRLKPDLILELGTAGGGSSFFYGTIMTA